jgi:hypothetical protein
VDTTQSPALTAALRLPGVFSSGLDDRLQRGLPFTLAFELELMRHRSNWFDAEVESFVYLLKVDFDPWDRVYSFHSTEGETEASDTAAVRDLLERQTLNVPLAEPLEPDRTYYFNARATLKLLTADDIREVEEWLGGHMRRRSLVDLPSGIFGMLKDAAGLGDESASARSRRFRLAGRGIAYE